MSKFLRICVCFALVLSTLFVWIGYAALSDELSIEGQLAFVIPDYDEVVITKIESSDGTKPIWNVPTTVDSTVNLAAGQSVTYTITVKNYSERIKYEYSEIVKDDAVFNNALLGSALTVTPSFPNGIAVEPGAEMIFTVKYEVTSASYQNTNIRTLLNYKFGVHVDSVGDLAVDNALKQFEKVLNDQTLDVNGRTPLERIVNQMTSNRHDYIGNVVGADSDDTQLIEELFENKLTLTESGVEKNVTCMIKKKQVNGRESMTLFLTPDEISGRGTVDVYAVVFFIEDGKWVQFGDMYAGNATKNNYNFGNFSLTRNSFDTETWKTTAGTTYKVCDAGSYTVNGTTYTVEAYSYTFAAGRTIDNVVAAEATDDEWRILGQMRAVADAVLNSGIYSESSEAIIALNAVKAEADAMYTSGQNNTLQAEVTTLMKEFSHILKSFADK